MEEEYDWLEYEEQDEPGPVGVRPLLEYCQGGEFVVVAGVLEHFWLTRPSCSHDAMCDQV